MNAFDDIPFELLPEVDALAALKNTDTEVAILSILISHPAVFDDISDKLKPAFFSGDLNRVLFTELVRQIASGEPFDVVTLADAMQGKATIQEIHAIAQSHDFSARGIGRMVQILSDRYKSMQLHGLSQKMAVLAFETTPVQGRIDSAMAELSKLDDADDVDEWVGAHEAAIAHLDLLDSRQEGLVTGIQTGLIDFDELLDGGFQRGNLVVIGARPSMGKAQPLGAKVLMRDGKWSPVGSMRIGDSLASIDGTESVVTGVFPQGVKPVVRVTFSDGRSTECCEDHLWLVHHRKWAEGKVMDTKSIKKLLLKPSMDGRLWVDRVNGNFGKSGGMPLDPWLLGALLGDGCLMGTTVRFSKDAQQTLDHVRYALPETVEMVHDHGCNWRLSVVGGARGKMNSNPLTEELRRLGLMGCNSFNKFVPSIYLEADRDSRLGVLRGLLDTDGWVEKTGSVQFSSASIQLAKDAQKLARSLGYWCKLRTKQPSYSYLGKKCDGATSYMLTISGESTKELFLFDGKRDRCLKENRTQRVTFQTIDSVGNEECQCISVSHPSHLYVTDDYVVTHNTALGMTVGLHIAEKHAVGLLSMEMPHNDVRDRQAAILSSASLSMIKRPEKGLDYGRIVDGVERSKNLKFYVSDKSGLNILQVRSKARSLKRRHGLDVLIVDYIGLMSGLDPKQSRAYQIEEISRGLKGLAKDLDIVVICLAQVNRAAAARGNNPPGLHELRDSGAIEQDADVVAFIHRPIMENPDAGEQYRNYGLLRVAKNRQGRCDDVHLSYLGEYTKFGSWSGQPPAKAPSKPATKGFGYDD